MAIYFLEKSASYVRQTSESIFRRRQVVCSYLGDDYKVRKFKDRETFQKILSVIEGEQASFTLSNFQADKQVLRYAHLYLMAGSEAEKADVARKAAGGTAVGIKCLKQDNIATWADLKLEGVVQPASTPVEPAPPQRPKLSELQAGQEVLSTFSQLVEKLEAMLDENETLRQEVGRLTEEAQPLQARGDDDQRYIELVEGELAAAEQKVRELRESIRSGQASAHGATLETIATENPDFPQLLVIAQQLKERRGKADKTPEFLAKLPTTFNWANDSGRIDYRDQFVKALESFRKEDQDRVIKQLETLANHGSEYGSLHTRKNTIRLLYSPADCLVSRGADDLRFTWKKNGSIVVFWLYRKGDSRVRQTEQ